MAKGIATQFKELKVRVPKELMDAIRDYRFQQQLNTRTEAVVLLLQIGLRSAQLARPSGDWTTP
jgi:hypothetical protein